MIKEISDTEGQPLIFIPLLVIMGISSLKDYFEDKKRKASDLLENNRITFRLENGVWKEINWHQIYVGDIIKVISNI